MSAIHRNLSQQISRHYPLPPCLLRLILPGRYYFTHFTDEGAEAQTAIKWFAHGLRPTVCRART